LIGALDSRFEVLASVPLIIEYEAVLTRSEHLEAIGLTSRQVNEVLDAFVKVSIPVPLRFLWRPQLKDPADEMVLETAVNGAARQFGIRVARPRDAWREVRTDETK
jgi:predicted nucleic acid-binding protein